MEDDGAKLEFFGKLKVDDDKSYASLREQLDQANVLDWPFDFWDAKDGCQVCRKIEAFNDILDNMHVIPMGSISPQSSKHKRIEEETAIDSELVAAPRCSIKQPLESIEVSNQPQSSSRICGDIDGNEDSVVTPKDVVD